MKSGILTVAFTLFLLTSACGGKWVAGGPVVMPVAAGGGFGGIVAAAKGLGYRIRGEDAERSYFRVRARLDNDMFVGGTWVSAENLEDDEVGKLGVVGAVVSGHPTRARISDFHVQMLDGGRVQVRATGYHVKPDGRIHLKLKAEFDQFVTGLTGAQPATAVSGEAI